MSDDKPKPSEDAKRFAAALYRFGDALLACRHPSLERDHRFERTGWAMLRAGVALIEEGDHARALAADWSARGLPSASMAEPGRDACREGDDGDVVLTSVEAAAMSSDQWERTVQQLDLLRRNLDADSAAIERYVRNTTAIRPNLGRVSTLIECANDNCDHTMTGYGDDRPKRGRCPRCYTHLVRHDIDWPARAEASA